MAWRYARESMGNPLENGAVMARIVVMLRLYILYNLPSDVDRYAFLMPRRIAFPFL
jgi:hypothetical protein